MPYRYRCSTVLRFADFSPEMMAVLKACLQPEPAKRLTALEVLELPYFDDVYEHLEGTELQRDYDAAYAAAAKAKAPSAHSLRTASSACSGRRIKEGSSATTLRASRAGGRILRRATTLGAPEAEGLCSVFSTLESQRRPVMQPLPSAAEATAAAAEAAAKQIATAGGRGRFGCRVRFSD